MTSNIVPLFQEFHVLVKVHCFITSILASTFLPGHFAKPTDSRDA